jgi:hypothetical protein
LGSPAILVSGDSGLAAIGSRVRFSVDRATMLPCSQFDSDKVLGFCPLPSGRGCDFGNEVAIGPQGTAEELGQTLDVAGLGNHSFSEEPLAHHPHVEGHPAWHELPEVLLKPGGVVAGIANRTAQHLRPDGGGLRARQRVGTNEIEPFERKWRGGLFTADEFAAISPMSRASIIANPLLPIGIG